MMRKLIAIISIFFFLISTNYVFGQNDEEVSEEPLFLRILYIVLLIGAVIAIGFSEHIFFRIRNKIRHSKNHGTYTADGKKVIGALPKGYSNSGRSRSENEERHSENEESHSGDGRNRFRIIQASMILLILLLAFTGVFVVLFLIGNEPEESADPEVVAMLNNFSLITWIVGIPLLILIIIKRRKSELTSPTGFTKLYFRRREPHQCTICQKHPASKKYHIKNVHKMKNVNVDDYFRDCGCDKCARYDKSSIEG